MIVMTYLKPGSSLIRNIEIGQELERVLLTIPGVKAVGQRAGRFFGDDEPLDSNVSHLDIAIKPSLNDSQTKQTVGLIKRTLNDIPGLATSSSSFLTHAIEDVLSGVRAQIVLKVFGPDSEVLQEKAEEISSILKKLKCELTAKKPLVMDSALKI